MSLAGVLSPSLSQLKSLRILSLYGNRFTGNIPLEFAEIESIWKLNLSSNALSGPVPDFLGDYQNLRLLDLSRNSFTEEIPSALFKNCSKTKFISLSNNNLTGLVPQSIANCLNLTGFDFSFNNLSGNFPAQICGLPSIAFVSLRSNSLVGNVEEQLSMCQNLELLDLGSNFFTGLSPFDVLQFKNLSYFNVSFNQFQGGIPEIRTCSDRMEIFDVSGNDLIGEIPLSIVNCRNLRVLNLGFNRLNGTIPVGIGNLKKLSVIRLGNNVIEGTIPTEISSIEFLQVLDLHNLKLSGEIPDDLSKCRFLLELDLSGNSLQGEIPQTLYNMTYLKILDLHRNRLNGTIPSSLGELIRIQLLDLSENSLSGPIPSSLGNLTLLTHLNLSFNNLSGSIPLSPVIQDFGSTAFSHNPSLCGIPLSTPCSVNGKGTLASGKAKVLSVSAIVAIVAAAVILCGVCIICFMNIRARKRKNDEILALESTPPASTDSNLIIGKLVLFSKSLPSKYEDWEAGTKALLDKECLIGGGSIGTVYKTNFEGGISIAVKKLETLGRIRNQDEFEQEIGRLGNLQHPNLVAFQGYYWSSTMQLILSEFISNGNLYQHLHGLVYTGASTSTSSSRGDLYWSRRFQIALGTARALAYLHHDCKPQVLHLNIKSTNILLDEGYEPKLSDYGLVKLLPMLDNYGLTKFHTAVGYVAPELACQSFRFSDKCDVYSFGVILLELVTGKKPVESPAATEVVVLCDHVRGLLEHGSASDCFDRSLQGFVENELIQVMKLGLICTSEAPSRRPSMAEVVQVLESIRSG
ncbi:Protein kinase domain [Macleaya cordata]|uniref:Protein kinase domain n=1 Tax=Macleaya cordata TaxID=56857 RepID=A0A200QB94_MACCD|nr:Protein kinase domain [Macleaya cordata]